MRSGRSAWFPGPIGRWSGVSFQVSELAENLKAAIYFFARKILQALGAEALNCERSHHAAVKQRALQDLAIELFLRSDVAHESAGERISGTSRILDFVD